MSVCGKLEWVPAADGDVPRNAIEAGIDGESKLFVARAYHPDGLIVPGKLHQSHSCVYIPYNMKEVRSGGLES